VTPEVFNPQVLDRFLGEKWDDVITVCDGANERCPSAPGRHAAACAGASTTRPRDWRGDERLAGFRRVRDEIRARLRRWLETV
jgi:arsenate reductase